MIKYIGSKRLLIPEILQDIKAVALEGTVLDLFSGTSRVGIALKDAGYTVLANDYATYAYTLARCYVQASPTAPDLEELESLIKHLNSLPGQDGYFTNTFSRNSRYVQTDNAEKVDAILDYVRTNIPGDSDMKHIVLTSLMEAIDRVDSTTGLQMAYLKQWSKRSYNKLELRLPAFPKSQPNCQAYNLDAAQAAATVKANIAYLDPPYNQHSYLGNYHIWETVAKLDEPEFYGIACKRTDTRTRTSDFNSKKKAKEAFTQVVNALQVQYVITSFNNEGFLSLQDLLDILGARGHTTVKEIPYKRYVGSKIGVHNLRGEKVSEPTHHENVEYLLTTTCK